jgi:hypothetical protein
MVWDFNLKNGEQGRRENELKKPFSQQRIFKKVFW